MQSTQSFSVVVPVYCCASCLELLCARLEKTLSKLSDRFEIILVDDRSPDDSWATILALQANYPMVKGIRLSRNVGQHIAITAGLAASTGDFAVVMDCDLQDPPETILKLHRKLLEGYDVVLANRARRSHSAFRRLARKVYFSLLSKVAKEGVDGDYGTLSILSRKVIEGFLLFGERERHYIFILRWLGFKIGTIDYDHAERASGRSSYSLRKLFKHAVDGLLFQTTTLLQSIVVLGLVFSFFGLILAMYFVYQYLVHNAMPGWTSVAVLALINTGVILVSLGVIGLYVGKIFDQTKQRPLYVVDTISEGQKK